MTTLADQHERVQWMLQDTDSSANNTQKITAAHQEALSRLARLGAFTQIAWINVIANEAIYLLPNEVVDVHHVFYNERVLRLATETQLDRKLQGWEGLKGEPLYYVTDGQAPNTIRLVPAPVRTGSTIPTTVPMIQDLVDNLVVFFTEDVASQITDPTNPLPTLLEWDDALVWRTARLLAERETSTQNLPVATLCAQLEQLWEHFIQYGPM